MGIQEDYLGYDPEGGFLKFLKRKSASNRLPPGQGLQLTFRALEGRIRISVHDIELAHSQPGAIARDAPRIEVPVLGRGSWGDWWDPYPGLPQPEPPPKPPIRRVPLLVELFSPADATPVASWTSNEDTDSEVNYGQFEHVVGSGPDSRAGIWTCRVTNTTTDRVALGSFTVTYYFDRAEVQTTDIPMRLLNHAFSLALSALMPSVKLEGHKAVVSFGPELKGFFDETDVHLLDDREIYPADFQLFSGTGHMLNVKVGVSSGADLLSAMRAKYEAVFGIGKLMIAQWESLVDRSDPVLHAKVLATDLSIDLPTGLPLIGSIHIGDMENVSVDVFCHFKPSLESARVLVVSPAEFSGFYLSVAEVLGVRDHAGKEIEDAMTDPIQKAGPLLGEYLGALLVNLVARGNQFLDVTVAGDRWRVRHSREPVEFPPEGTEPPHISDVDIQPLSPTRRLDESTEFVVGDDAASLARLDQIRTIVVLMMENRSFDHLLGYLREYLGEDYEGIDIQAPFSNPAPPPLINPIFMTWAPDLTNPDTQIPISPHHQHSHVMEQIADGEMSGFATDFADKGDPYLVMSYYTDGELPAYYQLASSFCVCDHWFAAHPGPTWPNKFASLMGTILSLENFGVDDLGVGWFGDFTILDLLSKYGITWRYFESDLSFARVFDAFRLDDQNVIPFDDPADGFAAFIDSEPVDKERVIFIDPNFVDIPPIEATNDDAPPADLCRGQELVKEIFDILKDSPHWPYTLFLITYDEHGGFADHVPPPGTPLGPPEWVGRIPRIHPDGAEHLGVRVPGFVISPMVSASSVCSEVFDHTSILKTILVRFRDRIAQHDLARFGQRVNEAHHLGIALNQNSPRSDVPDPLPACSDTLPPREAARFPEVLTRTGFALADARFAELERDARRAARAVKQVESRLATATAMLTTGEPSAEEDPDDFRTALRRAFAPRRTR